MFRNRNISIRKYVIPIIVIFIFCLIMIIDVFSGYTTLNNISDILYFDSFNLNFDLNSIKVISPKAALINENLRLEREIIKLRSTEEKYIELQNLIKEYEKISIITDNFVKLVSSKVIFINSANQYILNGGYNEGFFVNDLVIDSSGNIIGYLSEVNKNFSILEPSSSKNFNLFLMDENNNEYFVTSFGDKLSVELTKQESKLLNNFTLYSDPNFGHIGKFRFIKVDNYDVDSNEGDTYLVENLDFKITSNLNLFVVKLDD